MYFPKSLSAIFIGSTAVLYTLDKYSMSHWVKEVCLILKNVLDYEHEILKIKTADLEIYIKEKVKQFPLFVE